MKVTTEATDRDAKVKEMINDDIGKNVEAAKEIPPTDWEEELLKQADNIYDEAASDEIYETENKDVPRKLRIGIADIEELTEEEDVQDKDNLENLLTNNKEEVPELDKDIFLNLYYKGNESDGDTTKEILEEDIAPKKASKL